MRSNPFKQGAGKQWTCPTCSATILIPFGFDKPFKTYQPIRDHVDKHKTK
jgi:hypothetical protein